GLFSVAVVHRAARPTNSSVGCNRLVRFTQLRARRVGERARHLGSQLGLFKGVAISFEKTNLVETQSEHLIAVDRLEKLPQRFDVKSVRHNNQLGDGMWQVEYSKEVRRSQYSEPVERVVP